MANTSFSAQEKREFVAKARRFVKDIGKARDGLRKLVDEYQDVLDHTDEGLANLVDGLEVISRVL